MAESKLLPIKLKDWCKEKLRNEWEIYIFLVVIGYWYFLNINGAMEGDETLHAFRGFFFWRGDFSHTSSRPMGLYFIGLGEALFGRTTFGAKIFPMIFGIGAIYLVYRIAKELCHRIAGFFAAILAATIPSFALLSVSALLDTMLIFFSLLLFFTALKFSKAETAEKRQLHILLMGIFSIFIFTTKSEGICFIAVVFFYLLFQEWGHIKSSEIVKLRGILNKLNRKKVSSIPFLVVGAAFGALIRWQLSIFWDNAGPDGRERLLSNFSFLEGILTNLNSNTALLFFVSVGIIIFLILWIIYGLVGSELYYSLKTFIKREKLDKRHEILLYPIGIFSAVIVYLPFILTQPVRLLYVLFVGNIVFLGGGKGANVADSAQSDTTPIWAYFTWTYELLGWMFIIGIILSLIFTIIVILERKERVHRYHLLLFFYFAFPLLLYSLVSKKHSKYLVPLATIFSIYIVTHVPKLIQWILSHPSLKGSISKLPRKFPRYFSYIVLPLLLIIPGSFQMALNDPEIGFDSGYDDAAEAVEEYAEQNPIDTTYVFAEDKIALEFYLPYPTPDYILIIQFSEVSYNYSVDAIGRPIDYYSEEVVYDMLINGTIELAVFSPPEELSSSDNQLKQFIYLNNTGIQEINDYLALYFL